MNMRTLDDLNKDKKDQKKDGKDKKNSNSYAGGQARYIVFILNLVGLQLKIQIIRRT